MGQWDTRLWAPHAPQNVIVGRRGMARSMDSSRLDEDAMSASRFLSESFFFLYMNSQLYVQGAHGRGEWQRQCARSNPFSWCARPALIIIACCCTHDIETTYAFRYVQPPCLSAVWQWKLIFLRSKKKLPNSRIFLKFKVLQAHRASSSVACMFLFFFYSVCHSTLSGCSLSAHKRCHYLLSVCCRYLYIPYTEERIVNGWPWKTAKPLAG